MEEESGGECKTGKDNIPASFIEPMINTKKSISLEEFFKIYCQIHDESSRRCGEALREYWDEEKRQAGQKGMNDG